MIEANVEDHEWGPVFTVNDPCLTAPTVLILGGYDQKPELLKSFQEVFAEVTGAPSVGCNAFDTIPRPFLDRELAETAYDPAKYSEAEQALFATLPVRMIERALKLNELARTVLRDQIDPAFVLTHCAAANVVLLAKLLEPDDPELLPQNGLLVEPMLSEGQRVIDLGRQHKERQKLAETDSRIIRLDELTDKRVSVGYQGVKPLKDILDSRGVHLFAAAAKAGVKYDIVLGQEDVAAPNDLIREQLFAHGLSDRVSNYPDQKRFSHGYMLIMAREASAYIGQCLFQSSLIVSGSTEVALLSK